MLLIPCPHCGERDETEFNYGGRAIKYPALDESVSVETWHRVLHLRDNSQTVICELWYHNYGCECWFEITRDLVSHEISTAAKSNTPRSGMEI